MKGVKLTPKYFRQFTVLRCVGHPSVAPKPSIDSTLSSGVTGGGRHNQLGKHNSPNIALIFCQISKYIVIIE